MTNLTDIFSVYRGAAYIALKYSITTPLTLVGNLIDLCFLGYTKRCINVAPLMTNFPFFWEASREKERAIEDWSLFNKGFGGIFRAIASISLEIPLVISAAVLGSLLTALHCIFAPVVSGLGDVVSRNFCGA